MATSDEILDAVSDDLEAGVATSTASDGRSTTLVNPLDRIKAAEKLAATEATRVTGGAWGSARRARSVPPGSV